MTPCVAVVTLVRGRHAHLRAQRWGMRRQLRAPDLHVVVAMDDPDVAAVLEGEVAAAAPPWTTRVVDVPLVDGRLPVAAARNAGVAEARAAGAEVLVLLDGDCIPSAGLVDRYAGVLSDRCRREVDRPVVACGEVRHLDAATTGLDAEARTWEALDAGSSPRPRRPATSARGRRGADLRAFWSLSFATTAAAWDRVGGFDEEFVGYGGEDIDFGQRLGAAHGTLLWLGGAVAYHQHHDGHGPPARYVRQVVENANRFAQRWGWWPMRGLLGELEDIGLVTRGRDGRYAVTAQGPVGRR